MNANGAATRNTIIETAIKLLTKNGHAALSVDQVARGMGISKGNLTYHFPTKDLLLRAMFERLLDDTQIMRARACRRNSTDPLERFYRYIDFQLSLPRKPGYDAQSWETYAFCVHNGYLRGRVKEAIESYVQELTEILSGLSPELSQTECRQKAVMINALLSGMLLLNGPRFSNKQHREALSEQARKTAAIIAGVEMQAP